MSLYKDYIEEKIPNSKVLELDGKGFIHYEIFPDDSIYIWHLYVDPAYRNDKVGNANIARLLEQAVIDKEAPRQLVCDVTLEWLKPEESLLAILSAGYKIVNVTKERINLVKYLEKNNG